MAPVSGQHLDRLGPRRPILSGAALTLVATVLLAALSESLATLPAICIYVVFALGQSTMVGNTMTTSLSFLPEATKPDGNAVINTLQQLVGAIGTSVVTAVVNASQAGAADLAWATIVGTRQAYVLLAVAAVAPLASMAWVTREG